MSDPIDPQTGSFPAQDPDGSRGPSLARASAVMSAGTALSRVTGYVRIAVIAWAIGGTESKLPDTYNLANSMPNMVYQLVVGEVLATLFVPVFVEYITTRDREESWRLGSSILNLAIVISGAFAALTILFAPWIIKIWTFRLSGEERLLQEQVGAFFLRLFMIQMVFYAAGAVLTGILNAYRRFGPPMFAPALNNLIVIGTFVVFRMQHAGELPTLQTLTVGDQLLLGGGTTLGVVAMTLVLVPYVRALPGRHYRVRAFDWRHPAIRKVGRLAKYSIGYVVVNQIGLWVVYMLANARQGGVTAYQASWILYQLPYGIFAVSVMTFIVREVSEHYVRGDLDAVRRDVSRGLRTTAFIVLPASAGFIALSEPLMRVLLQYGVFEAGSTELFARTFVMMAVGLGFYTAFQQVMRAYYAMQDTRTPLYVNVAAVGANIVTAFPLYAAMGVPGLALSHALSYLTGAIVGGAILRRRIGGIDGARVASSLAKIIVASGVTGLVAFAVSRVLAPSLDLATFTGRAAQVMAAVASGVAAYVSVAYLLRIEELRPFVTMVAARLGRRRAS